MITLASILLVAWLLDRLLGDPNSWHPIVGMGRLIGWGEKRLNRGRLRGLKGGLYNGSLVVASFIFLRLLFDKILPQTESILGTWGYEALVWSLEVVGVFLMLSGTTLVREVKAVFLALEQSLEAGRRQVARIVGRDTQQLDTQEVRTAALETLSENLSDGVIAPLFWWMLLGLPGMVAYKMINTQDSMIGYRNQRYKAYGCFSARLDDLANYVPARLTALLMLLSAGRLDLIGFVLRNGPRHASPNSGYPEAALAGILGCRFGGPHDYFGQRVDKPFIGEEDRPLAYSDATQSIRINRLSEVLMLVLSVLGHYALS